MYLLQAQLPIQAKYPDHRLNEYSVDWRENRTKEVLTLILKMLYSNIRHSTEKSARKVVTMNWSSEAKCSVLQVYSKASAPSCSKKPWIHVRGHNFRRPTALLWNGWENDATTTPPPLCLSTTMQSIYTLNSSASSSILNSGRTPPASEELTDLLKRCTRSREASQY